MNICKYGCGQKATYQFKNGKWCCEDHMSKCPEERRKKSERCKGRKRSKETIEKVRQKNLGQKRSKETCRKISESLKGKTTWNKGIPHSNETKQKISIANSGKIASNETREKISKIHKGKILTNDHKRKISEAHTGKKREEFSKEWRDKLSKANKGKKLSNETKLKISKSKTGVPRSDETKRKLRLGYIKRIENQVGQISPNYNPSACKLIDEWGNENGYNFQHAENGGEFRIKELGYWVDGYDKEKNVVIEIDEPYHFDTDGNLSNRDIKRQKEITELLGCKFIRINI